MADRQCLEIRRRVLAVARGEAEGDLLFSGGRVLNVFTGEVEAAEVVVAEGIVAGIGPGYRAKETIELAGDYLLPGLIGGHTHIESSHLGLPQYARAVLPTGTTSVVTDLHELANVGGLSAIRAFLDQAGDLPLDVFLMAPSCVPATQMETSGASLAPGDIAEAMRWPETLGLGELMNFPGVISGDGECLDKADAALVSGKLVDGHAPGLSGPALNAYLVAGPRSDHESTSLEEGRQKLRRGMYLMIREGTSEKNLEELLPLVTDRTYPRCLFVVDDRSCRDLRQDGDMDAVIRKAVRLGLDPVRAVQLATINPATYFRLRDRGAVAPGYLANLVVTEDLTDLRPKQVYYRGNLVAENGCAVFSVEAKRVEPIGSSVNVRALPQDAFVIEATSGQGNVIEVVPHQIITRKLKLDVRIRDGRIEADTERDILKAAVVERHRGTGNIGLGLVRGFGLKQGAIGGTFAHDSHNIVVVGANDRDMRRAVEELERLGGGLVVVEGGRILASLGLPIAGLMSPEPAEEVAEKLAALDTAAASLGASIPEPFAVLSFLALPVIPELRLSDKGLVDVSAVSLVSVSTP